MILRVRKLERIEWCDWWQIYPDSIKHKFLREELFKGTSMGAGENGGGGVSGAYFRGMPIWGGFLLHWGLRGLLRPLLVRRGAPVWQEHRTPVLQWHWFLVTLAKIFVIILVVKQITYNVKVSDITILWFFNP